MKLTQADRQSCSLTLSYDEVYVLLQCVAETDRLDETETKAIMNRTKPQLEALAEELNTIKNAMRPS
ncbi:MAG: hypothetical protein KBA75_03850 [Alphaproteobacteria bacterium]|nr:hypothetical protein [Alphaproteobacteria bacterium]